MAEELYPEHIKLKRVAHDSDAIGQFLHWLRSERNPTIALCTIKDGPFGDYTPDPISIDALLAEYYGIDLKVLEAEKRAMLDGIRASKLLASESDEP